MKLPRENTYLLGTETKSIFVRGEECMVSVGGGFVSISEYYNRYSTGQSVKLYHLMKANESTFLDTVLTLLKQKSAGPEVMEQYNTVEGDWDSVNKLFVIIATFVEEKANEKRKSAAKKKKKSKKKTGMDAFSPDRSYAQSIVSGSIGASNGFHNLSPVLNNMSP